MSKNANLQPGRSIIIGIAGTDLQVHLKLVNPLMAADDALSASSVQKRQYSEKLAPVNSKDKGEQTFFKA